MGMDVYGKNDTSSVGRYFRRSVWGWRPLWDYCLDQHGEIAGKVEYGHSNDGDGLDANDSILLADAIKTALENRSVDAYLAKRNKALAELERPACEYCNATGIRTDEVGLENKMPEQELEPEMAMLTGRTHGWCNGCSGEGKTDAWETNYKLNKSDIEQFMDFLFNCGGFRIC
jgi:hypothetical protein